MELVGVVVKDRNPEALAASKELIEFLERNGVECFTIFSRTGEPAEQFAGRIERCELCVTLGGDGTLLFAARLFSGYGVPILGINMGGLGFLTEYRKGELFESLSAVMDGRYRLDERIMVDVRVHSQGGEVFQATGLNDLVITCGGISRLIELVVSLGDHFIGDYRSDGIIIATPTGSTAYSLAAGGPILDPSMDALVICPICPHILGTRPLVVPTGGGVNIEVRTTDRELTASIDGQIAFGLQYLDRVVVSKSLVKTRLVSLRDRSFYDIVREKLAWKG